jgi:hypothetical protein
MNIRMFNCPGSGVQGLIRQPNVFATVSSTGCQDINENDAKLLQSLGFIALEFVGPSSQRPEPGLPTTGRARRMLAGRNRRKGARALARGIEEMVATLRKDAESKQAAADELAVYREDRNRLQRPIEGDGRGMRDQLEP